MSELIQDVSFFEGESESDRVRKLRILQDELSRLGRLVNQIAATEDGTLDFGTVATSATAGAAPSGYINATVNGESVRIALYAPA